jgi:hypothetical protein
MIGNGQRNEKQNDHHHGRDKARIVVAKTTLEYKQKIFPWWGYPDQVQIVMMIGELFGIISE